MWQAAKVAVDKEKGRDRDDKKERFDIINNEVKKHEQDFNRSFSQVCMHMPYHIVCDVTGVWLLGWWLATNNYCIYADMHACTYVCICRLDSVGKGNSLARFGNDVPKIAQAFKAAEKMFPPGKAPLGPVGQYIKLKDPKW